MARRRRFTLIFAPETLDHLSAIERAHYSTIRAAIETQLRHEPDVPTRNRKPLEEAASFEATWELRCGPRNRFRVFYEVSRDVGVVSIVAIGRKDGSRLWIGREEFVL